MRGTADPYGLSDQVNSSLGPLFWITVLLLLSLATASLIVALRSRRSPSRPGGGLRADLLLLGGIALVAPQIGTMGMILHLYHTMSGYAAAHNIRPQEFFSELQPILLIGGISCGVGLLATILVFYVSIKGGGS